MKTQFGVIAPFTLGVPFTVTFSEAQRAYAGTGNTDYDSYAIGKLTFWFGLYEYDPHYLPYPGAPVAINFVPEPRTWTLLLVGVALYPLLARFRRID